MDQDTTGKSGPRSWRDRLGIDDQRSSGSDAGQSAKPAQTQASAASRPQPSAGAAPRVDAKIVAKPAPMAPRPGTTAKAPPVQKPAESTPAAKPAVASPQRAAQDDAFAERLRKHREAAEAAVKKRSGSAGLEKFSFAKKEVETAQAEKTEPSFEPKPAQQAAPRPSAPAPAPAPAPVAPAPAPTPQRPVQRAPQPPQLAPRPAAAAPVPAPRPAAAAPGAQPGFQPPRPGYGQPHYGGGQPQQPAYRPQGPGYAPPPGARPMPPMPPQGYAPGGMTQPGYAPQRPQPVARPPMAPQPYAPARPAQGDDDLFEDNGYRPAAPLGRPAADRAPAQPRGELRADFDDPFDDSPASGYSGRSARDYSQAYREYDEDFEDDEPRRGWGGIIMLILALLAMGALAIGLIYMYQSQKTSTGAGTGQVPTVAAPEQPAKAEPDANAAQQGGQQPQGRKLIYERILSGDSANQPEQIVPREETPVQPVPPTNEGGDSLPLPLPPPPQTQGSLEPGAPQQDTQDVAAVTQDTNNQEGAAGVEPAASAVSRGPISNPPVPRRKPRNLVASIEQAPSTQFRPVLQPAPAPQPLPPLVQAPAQQGAVIAPPVEPVQQPVQQAPAQSAPLRTAARDDDPLAGSRTPFNSTSSVASTQPAQSGPVTLAPQPQQQVALAPQPQPVPQPQQPVTSQDLQAFAPPSNNTQVQSGGGSGYVIQLAAYRSEQEAMTQYQQLKSRHSNLVGNLPPAVQQTNLGASGTFYRLGMGPMQSKQAATELCNKLIAAGERDCLVRRR